MRLASNGQEALDAIAAQLLIASSWIARSGDGRLRATRRLRANERYRHLPIIALTANALPTERERCRAAGMDAYLAKPIRSSDLFDALKRSLSHAPLWRSSPGRHLRRYCQRRLLRRGSTVDSVCVTPTVNRRCAQKLAAPVSRFNSHRFREAFIAASAAGLKSWKEGCGWHIH